MSKTCLLVVDDPMARQGLRGILAKLGLEVLEAASIEKARKCLSPLPDVVIVFDSSVNGSENMIDLLQHLPPRQASTARPRVICIEGMNPAAGSVAKGADIAMRLVDVAPDSIESTLGILKIIE